jgi:PhnB protein
MKNPPEGYSTITPYLFVKGASAAIEFYKRIFNASERLRMGAPDGKVMHAEIIIGTSAVMLADEFPQMNALSPPSVGGSPVLFRLYVENVDEVFQRALDAGAIVERPVQNQFYGDRSGTLCDPFGHRWTIATRVEEVPPEEMQRRMATLKPATAQLDS